MRRAVTRGMTRAIEGTTSGRSSIAPTRGRGVGTFATRAGWSARDDDDDETRGAAGKDAGGDGDASERPSYEAALGDTVRKVKVLSIASLAATVVGCPTFLELSRPEMVFEAKAAASATVIGFGSFTTALLQWFVSPYVKTMRIEPGGRVVARKFAWNASEYETTFAASDMRETESSRPLVSWEADGRYYYVEMGMVPKYMYEELDLKRFDDQAKAEEAAKNMEDDEE